MSNKLSSKEALKIIEDELQPSLPLVPLDKPTRTYGRAFAIGDRDGAQFLLLIGNPGNPDKGWRPQTTIVTEKWEAPPDISGVEHCSKPLKSHRLNKQQEHSRLFPDGRKVANRLSKPERRSCFDVSDATALITLISEYVNHKFPKVEQDQTTLQSEVVDSNGGGNDLTEDTQLVEDISEIQENTDSTTKTLMIEARLGQGKFKRDVIETWKLGTRCVVTGIDIPELLIASHIIPWRESDDAMRLDGANGLLLCSHLDKLFDRYLISFGDDLTIMINDVLIASQGMHLEEIGIDESLRLNTTGISDADKARIKVHLAQHRQHFMDLNNQTSSQ